jgi:2'-5' RNA ligase
MKYQPQFKRSAGRQHPSRSRNIHPRIEFPEEPRIQHQFAEHHHRDANRFRAPAPQFSRGQPRHQPDPEVSVCISFQVTDSRIASQVRTVQGELLYLEPGSQKQLIPERALHVCLLTKVMVRKSNLPGAVEAIHEAVREFNRPLTIQLEGTTILRSETDIPVLVACLTRDSEKHFKELAGKISTKLRVTGHVRGDADYTPHLTIASASRDSQWGGRHFGRVVESGQFGSNYRFGTQKVDSIALCTTKEKLAGPYTRRGNIQVLYERKLPRW